MLKNSGALPGWSVAIHDWTRVDAGTFHAFRFHWICANCDRLNNGGLPKGFFAMAERHSPDSNMDIAYPPPTEAERYARIADRIAVHHGLGKIVAIIEIVSPGNKGSRHAIRAFVDKTVGLLRQGIHLLVIDLFPPSQRDPQGIHQLIWEEIDPEPFELPSDKPLTLAAYSAGDVIKAFVEPVAVGDTLPDMALFLTDVLHVPTPLEQTYQTTWNVFPEELKELLEGLASENGGEDQDG